MDYKFLFIAQSGPCDFTRTISASDLTDALFLAMDDPQVSDVEYSVHPAHAAEASRCGMRTCTLDEFNDVEQDMVFDAAHGLIR